MPVTVEAPGSLLNNPDSRQMSRPTYLFDRLALELKQMIFKWAATDGNDVHIALVHDNDSEPDAPALEVLSKLQKVSDQTYREALEYLTSPVCRWVFNSKTQPHRYVLRAFHNHVPKELREKITHVYLPHITYRGLVYPSGPSTIEAGVCRDLHVPPTSEYTPYFERIDPRHTNEDTEILRQIKQDMRLSLALVSYALPSLRRLDINLDIIDFLCGSSHASCSFGHNYEKLWSDGRAGGSRLSIYGLSPLVESISSLKHMKAIHEVNIRIFWEDFLRASHNLDVEFIKEAEAEWQELFVEWLRPGISAKSFTGCSLTDAQSTLRDTADNAPHLGIRTPTTSTHHFAIFVHGGA